MSVIESAKSNKYYWPNLLVGLLIGYVLLIHTIGNGLVMTDDSFVYLDKAKHFAQVKSFSGIGFTTIFPFQSLQIFILYLLGENWELGIKLLNFACWTGSYIIFFNLSIIHFHHQSSRVCFSIILVFSTPLIMVHSFLWTEPLFIFLLSLQLHFLWKFIASKAYYWLALILLMSILYCWQRKAGMVFSLGIVISLIQIMVVKKQVKLIIISLIFACILLLYGFMDIIPNQIGELPDISSFTLNLYNYLGSLSAWLFPFPLNAYLRIVGLLFTIGALAIYGFRIDFSRKDSNRQFFQSLLIIALLYFIIRLFYHRLHYHEADRFLAPIYPLFFFFIIFVLDSNSLRRYPKKLAFTFITVILLWSAYPIIRTIKNADLWHNHQKKSLSIKAVNKKPL